jgi:sphinganine-1-phosphate aldolase
MANNAGLFRRSYSRHQAAGSMDTSELLTASDNSCLANPKTIVLNPRSPGTIVRSEGGTTQMASFRKAFPKVGQPWAALKVRMEAMRSDDVQWRRGRAPLHVYSAGADVLEVASEAYTMFISENALAPSAFPSLERMERDIIEAAVELFHAPAGAAGSFTSGGTESIILAVKAARDWARVSRLQKGERGEILLPITAHPAFDKAAQLLDLDPVRVEIGADFRASVSALEAAISNRTILMVGSAPSLPFGLIDPIEEIGELALHHGVWFHVDACIGGYIAPFASKLGYPIPRFDFSVPGVRSISADLHKFGYSAKGASTLLVRNRADAAFQSFEFSDWPKGKYFTPTLLGTRSGGALAAAWAVIHYLGEDGYLKLTARVMELRDRYVDGISAIPELQLLVQPDLSVISYGSNEVDIAAVGDQLVERGWYVSRIAQPPALHQTVNLVQEPIIDEYLADLEESVSRAKTHSLVGRNAEVLTY